MIVWICFNDIGGLCSFVNKWIIFLKVRLVCLVIDEDGLEMYFDELEDVFLLEIDNLRIILVYGIFIILSLVFKGLVVCVYYLFDI